MHYAERTSLRTINKRAKVNTVENGIIKYEWYSDATKDWEYKKNY